VFGIFFCGTLVVYIGIYLITTSLFLAIDRILRQYMFSLLYRGELLCIFWKNLWIRNTGEEDAETMDRSIAYAHVK